MNDYGLDCRCSRTDPTETSVKYSFADLEKVIDVFISSRLNYCNLVFFGPKDTKTTARL